MTTIHYNHPLCRWCGMYHTGICPRVRTIEYYPDGSVKRVELQGGGGGASSANHDAPTPVTRTLTLSPLPDSSSTVTIKAEDLPVGDGWISYPT